MRELIDYYKNYTSPPELARKLGISRQAVNQWLNGLRPVPEKHKEKIREILKLE